MSSQEQQPIPLQQPDLVWDALEFVYKNCAAYTIVPAALAPFMRNAELIAKVADQRGLIAHSAILAKDVKEYAERLNAIREQHKDRSGSSLNHTDMMNSIQIHEQYAEWAGSYQSVVMPTIETLLQMFADAGADTTGVAIPQVSTALDAPAVEGQE